MICIKSMFIILILLFFISYIFKYENFANNHKHNLKNICRGYLTDIEYLDHMIPHHQVAIDISKKLQNITKSPFMYELLRKLIFNQKNEILLMKILKRNLPKNISQGKRLNRHYQPTNSDFRNPNKLGLTNIHCDPHFFDPKGHMKHMKHMKLDDVSYIKHMIPHHQVAVDMSKVLLKNTKSDIMTYLAYRIIRSQQAEVILLDEYLNKSKFINQTNLI